MHILIVGLGNVGARYTLTRHNIGFIALDNFLQYQNLDQRFEIHGDDHWLLNYHNSQIHCVKPSTYMNNSGMSVKYWMNHLNISIENILIISDDIHLDIAKMRYRTGGSEGGHNGLKSISEYLNTNSYKRLRIGVGHDFAVGHQSDYVLSKFNNEELSAISDLTPKIDKIIKTMTQDNPLLRDKLINNIFSQNK